MKIIGFWTFVIERIMYPVSLRVSGNEIFLSHSFICSAVDKTIKVDGVLSCLLCFVFITLYSVVVIFPKYLATSLAANFSREFALFGYTIVQAGFPSLQIKIFI